MSGVFFVKSELASDRLSFFAQNGLWVFWKRTKKGWHSFLSNLDALMYVEHHSACFVTYLLIPLAGEKPVSRNWKSCLHWLRIVLQVGLPGGKKEEDSLAMIIGAAAGGILFVLVLLLVLCCCCCQRKTKRASPNSSTPSSHSSGNSLKMVSYPKDFWSDILHFNFLMNDHTFLSFKDVLYYGCLAKS